MSAVTTDGKVSSWIVGVGIGVDVCGDKDSLLGLANSIEPCATP